MSALPLYAKTGFLLMLILGVRVAAGAEECSGPPELEARIEAHRDADAYTVLGVWFDENHQTNCAVRAFRAGLDVPGSAHLHYLLGRSLNIAGRVDEAVEVLTEGLKAYPDSGEAAKLLVTLYVKQGHFQEAIGVAEKYAGRNPQDMEMQRIYLRLLMVNQNYDAALPLGTKLLALLPHDPEFLKTTGKLERLAGEYPAARVHLEEAVALIPNDVEVHSLLGVVLEQLQETAAAGAQLEEAIELGSREPEVHFELAKVLRAQGKAEQAQRELDLFQQSQKAKSDRMEANLKAMQAEQAVKAGDNKRAAELYAEASAASPEDPKLAYQLSHLLDDLGDVAGERAALERAIKADTNFARAHYQLGFLEFQSGKYAAAEMEFRKAVEAAPGSFQSWDALATTLGLESRFQEAQEAVTTALKLKPDDAGAIELSKSLAAALSQHPPQQ